MASLAPVSSNPLTYGGVDPYVNPPFISASRVPTTLDVQLPGTVWENNAVTPKTLYITPGAGVWTQFGTGSSSLSSLSGDTGTATPTAGNIQIAGGAGIVTSASGSIVTVSLAGGSVAMDSFIPDAGTNPVVPTAAGAVTMAGTANQITTTGGLNTLTFSIPATFIAPGSIAATTTLTATLGNVTATNGNFVGSAAGTGFLFNSPTATVAATNPAVVNGRTGQAIFTAVSIAAAADLTLTITNSAITGATTQVIYSMSGSTTGSAPSIKNVTNSAGSSAIVVTNGTGATTTTADIVLNFIVLN